MEAVFDHLADDPRNETATSHYIFSDREISSDRDETTEYFATTVSAVSCRQILSPWCMSLTTEINYVSLSTSASDLMPYVAYW